MALEMSGFINWLPLHKICFSWAWTQAQYHGSHVWAVSTSLVAGKSVDHVIILRAKQKPQLDRKCYTRKLIGCWLLLSDRLANGVSVEISRWHLSFCQTVQIFICARDFKMNGEEISKIQIEQYQKPSFYKRQRDSYFMTHAVWFIPCGVSHNNNLKTWKSAKKKQICLKKSKHLKVKFQK